jgi:nucleotide-binding universal stress UspA family protein
MFKTVLVGVDGHSGGRDAIALARQVVADPRDLTLACIYGGGVRLGPGARSTPAQSRERATEMLRQIRLEQSLQAATVLRAGVTPGRELHELAEQIGADLVVVGSSHRAGLGRVLLGDDTLAALNGSPCAVAIAPRCYASRRPHWEVIGVGHDGSAESDLALAAARELARAHHATLRVVSVVPLQTVPLLDAEPIDWTDATERVMAAERRRLAQLRGVSAETLYGSPARELERLAADVDLLAVGSRGYGPIGRLMSGSTSCYLARRARTPLLVTPRSVSVTTGHVPAEPSPDLHAPALPAS